MRHCHIYCLFIIYSILIDSYYLRNFLRKSSRYGSITLFDTNDHAEPIERKNDNTKSRNFNKRVKYPSNKAIEDVIDVDFVKKIIAEWSKPMPKEYVNSPLVLAGPSGE